MSLIEWSAQALLLILLIAAIPFAIRLERALAALRRDRGALDASAAGFTEATRTAEATLVRLRAIAEVAGKTVSERVKVAEELRDDLRDLAERAETAADRLERALRAARPEGRSTESRLPSPSAQPEPSAMRSQAERDLLNALRIAR
ncbi:hypothetical protein IAI18_15155 [Acetobacteraceae bacterium H6797]|nr:hypothetical protein [Acetobacteraceae bacterium H6797]